MAIYLAGNTTPAEMLSAGDTQAHSEGPSHPSYLLMGVQDKARTPIASLGQSGHAVHGRTTVGDTISVVGMSPWRQTPIASLDKGMLYTDAPKAHIGMQRSGGFHSLLPRDLSPPAVGH